MVTRDNAYLNMICRTDNQVLLKFLHLVEGERCTG